MAGLNFNLSASGRSELICRLSGGVGADQKAGKRNVVERAREKGRRPVPLFSELKSGRGREDC